MNTVSVIRRGGSVALSTLLGGLSTTLLLAACSSDGGMASCPTTDADAGGFDALAVAFSG